MKKHQSKSSPFKKPGNILKIILLVLFIGYSSIVIYSALRPGNEDINLSGIEITTNSKSDVYLNNIKLGSVNKGSQFLYSKIEPGEKNLKLINTENTDLIYEKYLIFEKGTKVTIDWNFGVSPDTSHGIVKYFVKKTGDQNKIRVIKDTQGADLTIDGVENNDGIILTDQREHTIKLSKDGYLSKKVSVSLINKANTNNNVSQAEKDLYDSYDLVIEISLFQIPFY
jgi:hypothetical protein